MPEIRPTHHKIYEMKKRIKRSVKPLNRLLDWEVRLAEFVSQLQRQPRDFVWGKTDCMCQAFGAVEAVTGKYLYRFRGRYKTERGAISLIKKHGPLDYFIAKIMEAHGQHEVHPAYAQRGDIIIFKHPKTGLCSGFCYGSKSILCLPDGACELPTKECFRAWRIT